MHGRTPKLVEIHHPPCDLCGSQNFEALARRDRRRRPLRTVVCRDCGLVRHWRVPSEEELAEFYGLRYRQDYHGEESPSPRRIMRAWQKGQRIFETVQAHLEPQSSVLEVGAGIGCTVKYFERQGFRAAGIEPHGGFQRYATRHLQASIEHSDVFSFQPATPFDTVLLVHVIEHFRSPRQALTAIRQFLRPDGQLYVECPDLAAHFRLREGMFHYAHIHNFTRATLGALAQSCGYDIVEWLPPGREPNLCVLLRAGRAPAAPVLDPCGYSEALAAFERYNWLTYHARLDYLDHRLRKVAGYVWERVHAKRFVAQLRREFAALPSALSSRDLTPARPPSSAPVQKHCPTDADHERPESPRQSGRQAA
jgi:2-polyprenyl-3-methyl-5-hydroxy-6-metoxy-1,4-benzoquinol methylase